MGGELILETTFPVDLERETARGRDGPAVAFLEREADTNLFVPFTSAGELAAGHGMHERRAWERYIALFRVLASTEDVCWEYGRLYRYLADMGQLIGTNDLWIAATAIAYQMPIVTRNAQHFRRAPNLQVVSYA